MKMNEIIAEYRIDKNNFTPAEFNFHAAISIKIYLPLYPAHLAQYNRKLRDRAKLSKDSIPLLHFCRAFYISHIFTYIFLFSILFTLSCCRRENLL